MQNRQDVHIVGAGVSGLIAAYELEQAGYSPIIIEKSGSVGGRVKTINICGYDLDLGFQVLLSAYPLARKYLDMDALELKKLESGALIYANNKSYLIGDPLRNWKVLFPTLLADIGSIGDKLKILSLNRKLNRKSLDQIFSSPETTTLEYLKGLGFSSKIISRFFRPFFAGIFLEPDLQTSSRMFEFVYKMFGEGYATIPKKGIGVISEQLKSKLLKTKFRFNTEVVEVTETALILGSGENIPHDGVIVTSNTSSLLPNQHSKEAKWKSCMSIYYEVDQTNIPEGTIALVTERGNYANNFYAYEDQTNGKTILSVTTLEHKDKSDEEVIDKIITELLNFTDATKVDYIHHFTIHQGLPDIKDLKMTAQPSSCRVMENVFLAGDYLYNGSLNAAMESGRLAALGLIDKAK